MSTEGKQSSSMVNGRATRLVVKYASDSDDDGGIKLKSRSYLNILQQTTNHNTVTTNHQNNQCSPTNSASAKRHSKRQRYSHQTANNIATTSEGAIDEINEFNASNGVSGTVDVVKCEKDKLDGDDHAETSASIRTEDYREPHMKDMEDSSSDERLLRGKSSKRKRPHRRNSDILSEAQHVILSDDLLNEIAVQHSCITALARFGSISHRTHRSVTSEFRRRFSKQFINLESFLSDGINGHKCCCVFDWGKEKRANEVVERICSLMEFLMSSEINILGFSNFPETLQSSCSSSVVGHRTRRMFQKTLRNFFERRLSMCHLENVSLKLFRNDQFVRMANQFSTQLTSIHIHIADRSQLREFKSLSHLENLIDVSLQINSSCPIVNCSHGLHITHVYNSDDDSSNDVAQLSNGIERDNKSLWPKTLRFVSFPKLRRFQIILSSNCCFDESMRRCVYLSKEFSRNDVMGSDNTDNNAKCSLISLMPSLLSLSIECAPFKLLRRICECHSKLKQLIIGSLRDNEENCEQSFGSVEYSDVIRTMPTVDDVLGMFFSVRHWKKFDKSKVKLEDLKLMMDAIRTQNRVFAIADFAQLLMTIFEVCPRLKNLEIALTCTPLSKHHIAIPYTWRRNILRTRQTALTHFRLYLREIEDPSGLRHIMNSSLKILPENVESISLTAKTDNVECVKKFLKVIEKLEDIIRFPCLDSVNLQLIGLPCFELLLMKLCAGSLQTMPYVSVLSAPMCRDRTELINNLIVFASKMINLKLFRIDEQCADLLLDPELDRCCALRKLCEEIGYKGLIEVWRMQSTEVVNEWKLVQRNYYDRENAFIGRRLKRNFEESKDSIAHLLCLFDRMATADQVAGGVTWRVPDACSYSISPETLATVRKRFDELLLVNDSEDDENDSGGGNEEDYVDGYGDDDSVGSLEEFVVKSDEDIVYEQDWDELDEAERMLDEEEVSDSLEQEAIVYTSDEESEIADNDEEDDLVVYGSEETEDDLLEEDEDVNGIARGNDFLRRNSFLDDEAQEDNDSDETRSDAENSSVEDEDLNETDGGDSEGICESELQSSSDEDLEPNLEDLIARAPQKRVNRKRIIISDSEDE